MDENRQDKPKKSRSRTIAETAARPTLDVEIDGNTITRYLTLHGVRKASDPDEGGFSAAAVLKVGGGAKYKMGRVVAQGGMGLIHEARDVNCRRNVAMKVLLKAEHHAPEDLVRFIEEAQITAQLEHPNIVPVHELGVDTDGNVFYTMKYVQGVTLTEVLDGIRKGRQDLADQYPLGRLLIIFQKVCDAVAFAHSRGVVHRDLKPDNIMIGDFGEVQVMDWGLAKVIGVPMQADPARTPAVSATAIVEDDDETVSPPPLVPEGLGGKTPGRQVDSLRTDQFGSTFKTMGGRVMGTPGFMAPEQARPGGGGKGIDARTDVYSLGAILYSILTLRASVRGKDLKVLLRKIQEGDFPPPIAYNQPQTHEVDPGSLENLSSEEIRMRRPVYLPHCPGSQVPPALSQIVMKAMSTLPADRYPTVKELQADVEAYQSGLIWHPVLDEDFSSPDWTSRWEVHGGQWEVRDGELRLFGGEPQFLLFKKPLSGDVRIEFECRQESIYLNDIACFLSAIRSDNWREIPSSGYEFKFGGFSNSANVLARSDRRLWSERASPIVRGEQFSVFAERVGSRLRFGVNGREIVRVIDSDPLSGPDRTAAGVSGWVADTWYRRIRVYTMGAPWKTDVLVTARRHLQKGNYATAMDLFQEVVDSLPDAERLEKAKRGHETAKNRYRMMQELPHWQEKLAEAWGGVAVAVRMDNDGLTVDVSNAGIEDLSPLRGLPVTTLYCGYNRIHSLEPLKGLPLITLNCSGNPLSSLEPLRGMPLNKLLCEGCPVESLEPLRESPLGMLNCGGASLRDGLEPLRRSALTWLCCWGCGITSLEPLRGLLLTALYCDGNRILDLEPLRGMPMTTLFCAGNGIASLAPLEGMPLSALHCAGNEVSDLSPLRGLPLNMCICHHNRIRSLEPLKDLPIGSLTCASNPLESLEPFTRTPPYSFLYDSRTLPDDEIVRAQSVWMQDLRHEHHARLAEVLLAARAGNAKRLRELSREFQGHRYLFVPMYLSWDEAKAFGERVGGHLVTITSREENNFVNSLLPGGSWFWMGLQTTARGPQWVTGEPFSFSGFNDSFRAGQPGPKVFWGGTWSMEVSPGLPNCFLVEWDS